MNTLCLPYARWKQNAVTQVNAKGTNNTTNIIIWSSPNILCYIPCDYMVEGIIPQKMGGCMYHL